MPHLPVSHPEGQDKKLENNIPRAIVIMCGAGLMFGVSSAILKGCSAGIPSSECAFFRAVVGFMILMTLALTGIRKTPIGNRKGILFLRGFFGAIASLAYVWAIPRMDLALANGLNQTSPIFVCIFAAIFLKERFRWLIYALVLLAFFGIALVIRPDVSGVNLAALLALGSAVVSGLAYTCLRLLQKTESPNTIVLWLQGLMMLSALVMSIFEDWVLPQGWTLFGLIMVGLTAFFAQMLMTRAYHYAPATIVAPFIYISTISSLVIAFVVWGELPGWLALIGCGIIIVSAVLIGVLPGRKKERT